MAIVASGTVTNPELHEIAARLVDVCQIALKRGAQGALSAPNVQLPAGSLERLAGDAFADELRRNRNRVHSMAGRSRLARGPFIPLRASAAPAVLDFDSRKSVFAQAKKAGHFAGLTLKNSLTPLLHSPQLTSDQLRSLLGIPKIFDGQKPASSTAATLKKAKQISLRLSSATAVRRFGLEVTDWGADDMKAGGDAQDSLLPQPTHIEVSPMGIGKFDRDGQTRNLSPDIVFAQFPLLGDTWPRAFLANVFVAESDASGAFLEFLRKLWALLEPEVVDLATKLVEGAAAGLLAGIGAGSAIDPGLGTLIGAVVGLVIGALAAYIIDSLEDDIFTTPGQLVCMLESPTDRFDGSLKSPTYNQQFTKGHALYTVDYYWQLTE